MIVEGIDQRYAQLGKVSYVPRKDHKRAAAAIAAAAATSANPGYQPDATAASAI